MLTFTANWIDPILDGSKTVTFRRASARLPQPGRVVPLMCRRDRPPFAWAHVLEVRAVRRSDVTDDELRADGASSRAEWLRAVRNLYGSAPLALVRFEASTAHRAMADVGGTTPLVAVG